MKTSLSTNKSDSSIISFPRFTTNITGLLALWLHDMAANWVARLVEGRGAEYLHAVGRLRKINVKVKATPTYTERQDAHKHSETQHAVTEHWNRHRYSTCTDTHTLGGRNTAAAEEISLSFMALTDPADVWPQAKQPLISSLQEKQTQGEDGEEFCMWRSKHSGVFTLSPSEYTHTALERRKWRYSSGIRQLCTLMWEGNSVVRPL